MERCHTQRFHSSAEQGERGLHLHMGLCQRPNIAKRVLVVDNGLLLSGIRKLAVIPCYSPRNDHIYQTALNERIQRCAYKSRTKKTDAFIKAHYGKLYYSTRRHVSHDDGNSKTRTIEFSGIDMRPFVHPQIIRLPADALLAYLHIP